MFPELLLLSFSFLDICHGTQTRTTRAPAQYISCQPIPTLAYIAYMNTDCLATAYLKLCDCDVAFLDNGHHIGTQRGKNPTNNSRTCRVYFLPSQPSYTSPCTHTHTNTHTHINQIAAKTFSCRIYIGRCRWYGTNSASDPCRGHLGCWGNWRAWSWGQNAAAGGGGNKDNLPDDIQIKISLD